MELGFFAKSVNNHGRSSASASRTSSRRRCLGKLKYRDGDSLKRSEWSSFADASILRQPSIARVEDREAIFSTQNQSIHLQRRKMQIYTGCLGTDTDQYRDSPPATKQLSVCHTKSLKIHHIAITGPCRCYPVHGRSMPTLFHISNIGYLLFLLKRSSTPSP